MRSDWDCTLEGLPQPPAVRLGLRLVGGLKAESASASWRRDASGLSTAPKTWPGGRSSSSTR